jgi:GNAT superfamily N-acetyltransferase
MDIPLTLAMRPAAPQDEAFQESLYASTRTEEMALTGWSLAQQDAFLRMQYNAQRQHYRTHYPSAEWHIVELGGQAIGRLIVDRSGNEVLLMDIALLPQYRGAGIGTRLIQRLQAEAAGAEAAGAEAAGAEAAGAGKPVRLHVESFNRALRLYERLGFVRIGDNGIYVHMEWRPDGPSA